MIQNLATVLFGLAASLCWGSGDFYGGLASRRAKAVSVVTGAYGAGFVLLVVLALIWREPLPALSDVGWSTLAGLVGTAGLLAFYSALSKGRMGIVAPVSAVPTTVLPALFGAISQGKPDLVRLLGFVLALVAIILISRPERTRERPEGLLLALLAGCGFGAFFVLSSRVHQGETFWPLAVARLTSILFMFVMFSIRRERIVPPKSLFLMFVMAGVLDAIGNAFFLLAAHSGRLDVASVLSSLYPAATVLLATLFLHERVTRIQAIGIFCALVAVPLISV